MYTFKRCTHLPKASQSVTYVGAHRIDTVTALCFDPFLPLSQNREAGTMNSPHSLAAGTATMQGSARQTQVGERPDMMSASEGEGGHGKVDVVREVA